MLTDKQWQWLRVHLRDQHDIHGWLWPQTEEEILRWHRRLHEQMLKEAGTPLHDPTH